ncbi:MAG: hypothetical protein ACE5GV_15915 [Candidatus Scalindua sp.]
MLTSEQVPDRRVDKRLDLSLQIISNGHKGETVNISSTGVYFEVITNDINAFVLGTMIPIQIKASATTPGFKSRDINLKGSGSVVRNDIKNVISQGNRLGVAMKFEDKLELQMGLSQGLL